MHSISCVTKQTTKTYRGNNVTSFSRLAWNLWVVKLSSAHLEKVLPAMGDCFEANLVIMVDQNLVCKLELTLRTPNEGNDIR